MEFHVLVVSGVLFLGAGVPCLGLGYATGWRKNLQLVNGFDEQKLRDPEGLARLVGGGVLAIGVLNCAAAGVLLALPGHFVAVLLVTNGLVLVSLAAIIVGAKQL